jgi:hypothetical protein
VKLIEAARARCPFQPSPFSGCWSRGQCAPCSPGVNPDGFPRLVGA